MRTLFLISDFVLLPGSKLTLSFGGHRNSVSVKRVSQNRPGEEARVLPSLHDASQPLPITHS